MKLNLLTHLSFLSLFFLFVFAQPRAQQVAAQLFRRQLLDGLIERDLHYDIELLHRALGSSLGRYHGFGGPALKAHEDEERPLPAFDPRRYKTTNALTPATPPLPPPPLSPPAADHPAEHHAEPSPPAKAEKPTTPPVLPEIHPLSPLSPGFPESDDHYASDKSTGSAGSANSIVDRRKKPARGGRSHAHPHGKRDEIELAAPFFLQAKLGGRDVDELEDFFDYY